MNRQIPKQVVVDAIGGIIRRMDEHPAIEPKIENIDPGSLGSYEYRFDGDQPIIRSFDSLTPEEKDAVEAEALAEMYSGEARVDERRAYYGRAGVKAAHVATLVSPKNTVWMMERLRERILGKVVVEIGAGLGFLAIEMAKVAKRVFAVEADPYWTGEFSRTLYQTRPLNLMWIFDTAENVLEAGVGRVMKADVAVVVTGSDKDGLRAVARRFVRKDRDVVMPWQDYNDGRAIIDYKADVPPNGLHRPWPDLKLPK